MLWLIGKGCRNDGIIVHSIIPSFPRCFERSSFYWMIDVKTNEYNSGNKL